MPFQIRLTQTKPVLLLLKEHGSQLKIKVDGSAATISKKKNPYRTTRAVSLLSRHASYMYTYIKTEAAVCLKCVTGVY
jgi:hypothetical protein